MPSSRAISAASTTGVRATTSRTRHTPLSDRARTRSRHPAWIASMSVISSRALTTARTLASVNLATIGSSSPARKALNAW
jgi:hypothetical protein